MPKYLSIYLNDHLAVLAGSQELATRSMESNGGTALGEFLQEVVESLDEDRAALEALMDERDVTQNWAKSGGAWLAERVGRLKLNGEITGYSPLSRLVETEGVELALHAKRSFWDTLSQVGISDAGGRPTSELANRTNEQIVKMKTFRLAAAQEALGSQVSVS